MPWTVVKAVDPPHQCYPQVNLAKLCYGSVLKCDECGQYWVRMSHNAMLEWEKCDADGTVFEENYGLR